MNTRASWTVGDSQRRSTVYRINTFIFVPLKGGGLETLTFTECGLSMDTEYFFFMHLGIHPAASS